MKDVAKSLKPELISRLDSIVIFRSLNPKDIEKIVRLEIGKLKKRLRPRGVGLWLDEAAIKYIATRSFSLDYGARKVRANIQKIVEDPLAQKIVESKLDGKKKVLVSATKKGLTWKFL